MSNFHRRRLSAPEQPSGPNFPPSSLGDFTIIGEADMTIDNGLLTTSDARQVDAVRNPFTDSKDASLSPPQLMPPRVSGGHAGVMLAHQSNPNVVMGTGGAPDPNNGYPTYWTMGKLPWPPTTATRYPAIFFVQDRSLVAGFVNDGTGTDIAGHAVAASTGNHVGDLLLVNHSGPYIVTNSLPNYPGYWYEWGGNRPDLADWNVWVYSLAQSGEQIIGNDTYVWDGTEWIPVTNWVGYPNWDLQAFVNHGHQYQDWNLRLITRGSPVNARMYAANWTAPGPVGEGVKFRAQINVASVFPYFRGAAPGYGQSDAPLTNHACVAGVTIGMSSILEGLVWVPWGAGQLQPFDPFCIDGSGWTKRPADLKQFGDFFPPVAVRSDGSYVHMIEQPTDGATVYADLEGWPVPYGSIMESGGDPYKSNFWRVDAGYNFWIEVWRQGNRAFAAYYSQNPEAAGVQPQMVSEFPEDLTGTPYDASQDLYFGVVFPYLNRYAGLRHCEYVRMT